MGSDIVVAYPAAREIFERASDTLGFDMQALCFEDPKSQLGQTRFTQPALLTHEVACLEAFRSAVGGEPKPTLVAGHSLGEYSALVASQALSFEDGLRLVARRGELMSEFGRGGMVATTLDRDSAYSLADRHFCGVGGCNLPDQTVIAGEESDLEALVADMAKTQPGKRAIRLDTEGAFHTHLMIEAAMRFRSVLEEVEFSEPICSVLSNYTGKLHEPGSQAIRSCLFFQLFHPVRWLSCMNLAFELGVKTIVEFGGGIGKQPEPENKRPNLEGIIKKSLKFAGYDAQYVPAINAATIGAATEHF
jgi:[acyl-carrier-protein] S-malonyltransferase